MKLKRYCFPVFLFIIAATAFACNKADDSAAKPGDKSQLNVIDAVSDTKAIDFYLNGTRQNVNSAIYFLSASGYTSVLAGQQQYQFKSDSPRVVISAAALTPAKKDSSYTVVVAGQIGNNTLSTIFLTDYFPFFASTNTTKANVRFIQASPGNNLYDVFVGDSVSFKNQAYKSTVGFTNITAGKKTIKVNIAGTSTNVYTGTTTFQVAAYYTLFTTGAVNGAGNNAFGIGVNLAR